MEKGNFIGVVPPLAFETLWYPKRLLLMFDSLALDLNGQLTGYESHILKVSKNEIDYLNSEGLLTTLSGIIARNLPSEAKEKVNVSGSFLLPQGIQNEFNRFTNSPVLAELGLSGLRHSASQLRKLKGVDAVAISTPELATDIDTPADRTSVIQITLSEFPMPSDSVPWDSLLDFKANDKAKLEFQRLKVWINKISRQELKEYEVIDELRELMYSYERQMKLSKLKCQKGKFKVILTAAAEIIESLVWFKPSRTVKAGFEIQTNKIKLLEEENNSYGKEIAYIISSKNKFK